MLVCVETFRCIDTDCLLRLVDEQAYRMFVAPLMPIPIESYAIAAIVTHRSVSMQRSIAKKPSLEYLARLFGVRQLKDCLSLVREFGYDSLYVVVAFDELCRDISSRVCKECGCTRIASADLKKGDVYSPEKIYGLCSKIVELSSELKDKAWLLLLALPGLSNVKI